MKITTEITVTVERISRDELRISWPGAAPRSVSLLLGGKTSFTIRGERECSVEEFLEAGGVSVPPRQLQ